MYSVECGFGSQLIWVVYIDHQLSHLPALSAIPRKHRRELHNPPRPSAQPTNPGHLTPSLPPCITPQKPRRGNVSLAGRVTAIYRSCRQRAVPRLPVRVPGDTYPNGDNAPISLHRCRETVSPTHPRLCTSRPASEPWEWEVVGLRSAVQTQLLALWSAICVAGTGGIGWVAEVVSRGLCCVQRGSEAQMRGEEVSRAPIWRPRAEAGQSRGM